ncbi:MAG: diguanylate cyclase [Paraglaciecola sp.]|uniref:sensor domain-containing diguanylate cyclase n=1 Tax=Paraglaciecola sp. TaxID=1920173 RepID=UPI003297822D
MSIVKNNRITWVSRFSSILIFLACIGIFAPLIVHFGHALSPSKKTAEKGELFLQISDFELNSKVALTDGWLFFESQLVLPHEAQGLRQQANVIQGVSGWKFEGQHSNHLNGYGTYYLTIHLPKEKRDFAMKIPQIESAYRLYIDDNLMAQGGVVSDLKSTAKPGYNSEIILLPNDKSSFTLTIQVSSYHTAWGGLWTPIVIGNANDMFATQRDLVALSMFILGVLTITAAFYLIQFYLRPTEKMPLVFACLCMLLLFREFTNEHMLFVLQFLDVNFIATVKMNYLTFYLGVPTILYFMQLCFPQIFRKNVTRVCYGISAFFSVFVLVSPTQTIGYSLLSYQAYCLVVTTYLLVCLCIASFKKLPAAKMMLLGCFILGFFAINDILFAMDLLATGRFFSLGIVGFILCQGYVINNHFNEVRSRNEALSGQLQQRNIELQQLGAELETKVEQRTRELEKANRELQTLAEIDQLTGSLNRLGLQKYLQSCFERLRRSNEPSSIVLFDFDNFKNINDSFGHNNGDKILKSAVTITKELIREQDKIARWGGEEFLVLLPDTEKNGALAIAEKLRIAIEEQLSDSLAAEVPVTITAGVAQFQHNETFEILFKRADNAMYKGKRMGRNCVQS